MLRRPERSQKRLPPYEADWRVYELVGPAAVRIRRSVDGFDQEKTVHVNLVKPGVQLNKDIDQPDVSPAELTITPGLSHADDLAKEQPDVGHGLRARSTIRRPSRFLD